MLADAEIADINKNIYHCNFMTQTADLKYLNMHNEGG